jgi:hypothetical protein
MGVAAELLEEQYLHKAFSIESVINNKKKERKELRKKF